MKENSFLKYDKIQGLSLFPEDDHPALFLNAKMEFGISKPSNYFSSPQLLRKDQFQIVNIELYKVT